MPTRREVMAGAATVAAVAPIAGLAGASSAMAEDAEITVDISDQAGSMYAGAGLKVQFYGFPVAHGQTV